MTPLNAQEEPLATYVCSAGDVRSDRELALTVWSGALGDRWRTHDAKYHWFYLACPWGPPLLKLIHHVPSGTCIGTCAAGPRRMLWQGRDIRAGILADMAISPQHRTLGPALMLQESLAAAAGKCFDLIYGFPNARSIAVACRAGYPIIGHLRRYSRVLRHTSYLERTMPRWLAQPMGWLLDQLKDMQRALHALKGPQLLTQWSDHADPRMDQLWQESPHGDGLISVRDAAMLDWRFGACPAAKTRYLLVREPRSERLLAWFACQEEQGTLCVRDFWSRDAALGLPRQQVEVLLRVARRHEGAPYNAVSLEYASPPHKVIGWLSAGFVERGKRPVVGRSLMDPPVAFADLHFTAADEDE